MLDTIVKSLFPIDRLDRLEAKINQLEKDVAAVKNELKYIYTFSKANVDSNQRTVCHERAWRDQECKDAKDTQTIQSR
jgi:hypothetical protein